MATKKKEPEWLTDKMNGHTIHIKNSKEMRDFFSAPKGVGNPLESHRMVMLDTIEYDGRPNIHSLKMDVPIFPEVKVIITPLNIEEMRYSRSTYPPERMVIRTYVRVPDDEGNNYFTTVMSETVLHPTDKLEDRSREIAQVISKFNTQAYGIILLGVPEPDKVWKYNGEEKSHYTIDTDTRTERERMKDLFHERGYKQPTTEY